MDIKSKSRYLYITALIIAVYMLGLSLLSACDCIIHKNYLGENPYFSSQTFKGKINDCFLYVKAFHVDYKDYDKKTDEQKISAKELKTSKQENDKLVKNKVNEVEQNYKYNIDEKQRVGNKDEVNRLIDERDNGIDYTIKKYTKSIEEIKKEILEKRNNEYEYAKDYLVKNKNIKYYIIDGKTKGIYTNIKNVSNIDEYIKNNALYSMKFSQQTRMDSIQYTLIKWFKNNGGKGYFIIPKVAEGYSQMQEDYQYYNSMKKRVIEEIIIGIFSFVLGLFILKYITKNNKEELICVSKLRQIYGKVPLDIRIIIFMIYSYIILSYVKYRAFFYKPINIKQFFTITFVAIYVFYFILSLNNVRNFIKHHNERKAQWNTTLLYKFSMTMKDSFMIKSLAFKAIIVSIITMILGIFVAIFLTMGSEMACSISFFFIVLYLMIVPMYVLKKIGMLNKIIKGTEEIASGNLNCVIDEKGDAVLCKLAHNINNMKDGFKKSLESQVKSERLKSELITNVSHDLKTPLTSIINYIDLLKTEGITEEEMMSYIKILDRKSNRLKILIEDLFEASKVASGAVELNIEKVDVAALLNQSLAELDEKIKKSSLTFKVNISKQKIYLNLDGKKTWRVFENLINNILKYSQPDTRVYIDLIEKENKVLIIMKNISSYEMNFNVEEIFERFKRGDKARKTEGSGLGLAIAKSIVELQGGKLNIEIDGDLFKSIVEFNNFKV